MNIKLFFTFMFFVLSLSIAMAETHPQVREYALKHCNHEIFPNEDDQIDCVTDIVNCVVVSGGKFDLTKLTPSCLNKKAEMRIREQSR